MLAKTISAIVAAAVCLAPAVGQDIRLTMHVSGNDLYARCTTDQSQSTYAADYGFCRGYIYAAADFFGTVSAEANRPSCKRQGVTNNQLVDVVIKYLRDHPEERDRPGVYSVIAIAPSLMVACPR